jgi:hypothetical protein
MILITDDMWKDACKSQQRKLSSYTEILPLLGINSQSSSPVPSSLY